MHLWPISAFVALANLLYINALNNNNNNADTRYTNWFVRVRLSITQLLK